MIVQTIAFLLGMATACPILYGVHRFTSRKTQTLEVCDMYCDIPKEKAIEYMQVAAMVCLDLDLLNSIAKHDRVSLEELIEQIDYVAKLKDQLISDPEVRNARYMASVMLFSLKKK